LSDGDVIPFGEFKLFDRVIPPLNQGEYKVTLEQTLPSFIPNNQLSGDRYFNITGPRWHLNSSAVHSMTPPDKEQDAITSAYLPMVVLQRRTLPWERDLFHGFSRTPPVGSSNEYPSMALLLFTEEEITFNKGDPNEYVGIFKGSDGLALGNNTDSLVSGNPSEPGVFDTSNHDWADDNISDISNRIVDVVQVPFNTLKGVCPTLPEIRLLAHARQVNPMDKEQCGSDADGWFSVVMGNRLPTKTDTKYHACLVSLEGRLDDNFIRDQISETEFNDESYDGGGGDPIEEAVIQKPPKMYKASKTGSNNSKKKEIMPMKRKASSFSKKYMNLMNILMASGISVPPIRGGTPDPIKLVLLHHWTFKTSVSGGDYESRMKSLRLRIKEPGGSNWDRGELVEKTELLDYNTYCRTCNLELGLNYQGSSCPSGHNLGLAHAEPMLLGNDMAKDVSRNGYLTTEMVHSDGGISDVVYRGPLTPLPVSHIPKEKPYFNSDQALSIANDVGGIQSISHASAFELGRLLAYSDHTFVKAAARWRQTLFVGEKVKLTFDAVKANYCKLDIDPIRGGSLGNIGQSILKTTTQCMNQTNDSLQKIRITEIEALPPDLGQIETSESTSEKSTYSAQATQISESYSMGTSSQTDEINSLQQLFDSATGGGGLD